MGIDVGSASDAAASDARAADAPSLSMDAAARDVAVDRVVDTAVDVAAADTSIAVGLVDAGVDASAPADTSAADAAEDMAAPMIDAADDVSAVAPDATPDATPDTSSLIDAPTPPNPGPVRAVKAVGAGQYHTCAVLMDGRLRCWGYNQLGQLGVGDKDTRGDMMGELGNALPTVMLGTGRTAKAVAGGNHHTCAILDNDTIKCWGDGSLGQVGIGVLQYGDEAGEMGDALKAIDLGGGHKAKAIAAGSVHTCAILDDGTVKCWGNGAYGNTGRGNKDAIGTNEYQIPAMTPVELGTGRTATAIAASSYHTCVLLDDRSVKCWGENTNGILGLGNTNDRGDEPNEMGNNLPAVNLGTGKKATAISTFWAGACAILEEGSVKCWGYGGPALGLGDSDNRGDQASDMGDNLPTVALGTNRKAKALVSGGYNCAILDDDSLKCWGDNGYGALGQEDFRSRGASPSDMGDNLLPIKLGTDRHATGLTVGANHVCAVLDNTALKCWGSNELGQIAHPPDPTWGGKSYQMGDYLIYMDLGP